MAAYTALLALQPDDPAELHYQLAQLLESRGDRALAKRSRQIGLVDARVSLVAVDPGDSLARDRLALAARGGTFSRIPPPPEAQIEEIAQAHVEEIVDVGARYIMDTAARIRADLLAPQLLPAAKRCRRASLDDASGGKRGR